MPERLTMVTVTSEAEIADAAHAALRALSRRETKQVGPGRVTPLENCCKFAFDAGAVTIVVQTKVQDPDFLAEFSAYYSRQFVDVPRFCTRLHFFSALPEPGGGVLNFLDFAPKESFLGFLTLRPVVKSPVGATILKTSHLLPKYVRCSDSFPVNLAGVEFSVTGTPFMQQDNAVGACAQASIWMALRTLRKREGARAYDPAQITDAATRYFVNGRTLPNRQGLTHIQIIEAIRAAGYSPHMVPLGDWHTKGASAMLPEQFGDSRRVLHAYIESEIPVILILFPPSGGHAVVALGHDWDVTPNPQVCVSLDVGGGCVLSIPHSVSWARSFLIHNDNTGPYRLLLDKNDDDYAFEHAAYAIPLLPADVFMSGEEASQVALEHLADIFREFKDRGIRTDNELKDLTAGLALRLLLVEKRKLRKWAATEKMVPELREHLRVMDLPKRVWMLEVHQAANYGQQNGQNAPPTLVALLLIDPTADIPPMSMLLMHFNLPALVGLPHGVLVKWDTDTGAPSIGVQTNDNGPIKPIRI
ncbi:hypothetical protein [Lacisediminimonas profundi]|uniref:hypothetical protein n=1 Tax=Lacisediminimonas profundi TaxID=2603856 RepID=UPI00124B1C78|nr:hypothetical protein [Lacisediminimonas profundi]